MNFRDLNGRKNNRKNCLYSDGVTLRDMNFRSVRKATGKSESGTVQAVPEQKTAPVIPAPVPPQPASQYINRPVPPPSGYYRQPVNTYQNSMYIQPSVINANIPRNIPVQNQQSQFIYYPHNNNIPPPQTPPVERPVIPVPPQRPPEPEKPDPSKFVEEYVPTPPPKMVKAKPHAVIRKPENENADFGGFGGTFDGNPDQSTPVADIPVMNNIDDFKI